MKNLKKQINKILVNFVEQQNAKQIKSGAIKVEASSGRLSHLIAVKTIANLDHPTDSKRFDIELVSDYKANYFYKGTKNLVNFHGMLIMIVSSLLMMMVIMFLFTYKVLQQTYIILILNFIMHLFN